MLAIARGEQISAIWFVVVALSSYAIAYRFYAYYIQIKIMRTDDANATAAERVQDGANFESADRRVLFGQHFAAISGAGPLVGPILAAQMGYLPSVLWIILGVIFAGAVQDMLMLWISAKRRGRSFGQMATDEMGKVGVLIISVFLVVVTAIAMAVLALVAIKAMASSPWAVFSLGMTIPIALIMGCYERFLRPGRVIETTILGFVLLVLAIVGGGMIAANPVLAPIFTLNAKQLVVALVLYSFAAAALPHWLLVTPRDYLSTLMKIGTLALLVIGVVIANPQVQVPALTTLASRSNGPTFSGNLFPFLFITIACGALSGFHGAVSSGLTPKAIEKENQIRMIGYGSMLVESFTAIIALIAAVTISQGVYFSMNMSPSQIEATAGSAYSASASPEQNAAAAVSRMDVHNIEGQRMRVEWQSDGTVYTGAEALDAAAHDVGEETLVSRTGGATTFAIGMANFLRSYLGGEESMAFWYHFAIMFEALFILTTVDNGTRVCGPLSDRRPAGQCAPAQEIRRPHMAPRQPDHDLRRHGPVGHDALHGRLGRQRRHQRDGADLWHLEPAALRRLLHARHRLRRQSRLGAVRMDPRRAIGMGRGGHIHRRLREDLRPAARVFRHRFVIARVDRLRAA